MKNHERHFVISNFRKYILILTELFEAIASKNVSKIFLGAADEIESAKNPRAGKRAKTGLLRRIGADPLKIRAYLKNQFSSVSDSG